MNEYTIELHEFQIPATLGIGGHYFLVLKDSSGNVLHELHGHAWDPLTGVIDYAAINPFLSQQLKSVLYDQATYYNPSSSGQVLWQGAPATMLNIWELSVLIGDKITQNGITYSAGCGGHSAFSGSLTNE